MVNCENSINEKNDNTLKKREYALCSKNENDKCLGHEVFEWYKIKKVDNQVNVMEFLYRSLPKEESVASSNNGVIDKNNQENLESVIDKLMCMYGAFLTKVKLDVCFTDENFFKKKRANVKEPVVNYEVYEAIMSPPMLLLALINSLTLVTKN